MNNSAIPWLDWIHFSNNVILNFFHHQSWFLKLWKQNHGSNFLSSGSRIVCSWALQTELWDFLSYGSRSSRVPTELLFLAATDVLELWHND
jgi:hypothetical protein